jgi:thioesterase domain-containing protein
VGESDNFFALGGDSLSSLKVMARMRTLSDMKFNFKLRDLMQRPTIAGLLGLKVQASTQSNALLALNRPSVQEAVWPLFCIHAGLGTVFDYQPLARQFQNQRTVYGLPCRMLGDPAHRDDSLEQMAKDYCGIIRSRQPEGPYHLIGWSLGGTLAAMIAARLEAEAQAVAFLGLIDPFIPDVDRPDVDDWRRDFSDFVSVLLPHAATGVDAAEGEEPPDGNLMDSLPESMQMIADRLERLIAAADNNKRKGTGDLAGASAGGYADMGAEELARIFMVARHLKAISEKAPSLSPLLVEPVCWWAAARPVAERLALAEQISQHELHSIEIDADHFGIVREDALMQTVESALGGLPTVSSA